MFLENMTNVFFVACKFRVTRRAKYYVFRQLLWHILDETLKLASNLWAKIQPFYKKRTELFNVCQ
jgi:hypothetical protein